MSPWPLPCQMKYPEQALLSSFPALPRPGSYRPCAWLCCSAARVKPRTQALCPHNCLQDPDLPPSALPKGPRAQPLVASRAPAMGLGHLPDWLWRRGQVTGTLPSLWNKPLSLSGNEYPTKSLSCLPPTGPRRQAGLGQIIFIPSADVTSRL